MTRFTILLLLCMTCAQAQLTIAIQPIGDFDTNLIAKILPFVSREYADAVITVLAKVTMPQFAFYPPRNRYRAERILDFLDTLDTGSVKVVGLTNKDISTTKGEYEDWGIFGLGNIGGRPCVVSIFRLHRKAEAELFPPRLRKLIVHELGHTFGLEHCSWPLCVMADYKGTIASLDRTNFHLCAQCRTLFTRSFGR
jgi:archaemetzincin